MGYKNAYFRMAKGRNNWKSLETRGKLLYIIAYELLPSPR